VSTWHERKAVGDTHEQRVALELERRGWVVSQCGTGLYEAEIRWALGRSESRLREFPDLIAARDGDVVTVDAKDRVSSAETGRYAISRRCLVAGMQFLGAFAPVPLYYVFGNLGVLTPAEVMHYGSIGQRGGAYYLVPGRLGHHFDDVFGGPARDQAA
jgi:hypothetical protein